jgi:hypothetical protein
MCVQAEIEEVTLPGVELIKLPKRAASVTVVVHLTPFYTVADLRSEIAGKIYCIGGDISLYMSEHAAAQGEELDLKEALREYVEGGPKDEPPTAKIYALTNGKRYGYSSTEDAYFSTGSALLHERKRVLVHTERESEMSCFHAPSRCAWLRGGGEKRIAQRKSGRPPTEV